METFGEPVIGGRTTCRRDFLRMGGAALAGLTLLGVASPSLGQTTEETLSALGLGISPTNTAIANRENLVKALAYSKRHVVFPAGDYRIDNSGTPPIIRGFGGIVDFAPSARFIFTDNRTKGLVFQGGTWARFYGLRTSFSTLPPVRVNARECLHFIQTTDTLIRNAVVNGSAAAGILFGRSIRPKVRNVTINDTCADGLHFANCQDASVVRLRVNRSGDDGLAFLDYGDQPLHGGYATDIQVRHGGTRGITVVGQQNVEVSNFLVDTVHSAGVYVAHEKSYSTGTPRNVHYHDGEIIRAGHFLRSGKSGANPDSIFYNGCTEDIKFSRIVSRCPVRDHVRTGGQVSWATLTDITRANTC